MNWAARAACVVSLLGFAAPAFGVVDPPVRVTDRSPFAAGCEGAPQSQPSSLGGEAEPWIAVNPTDRDNAIAVWQQDRFFNGGARGLGVAYSNDGGETWTRAVSPPFSACTGGTVENGGDLQRATDPWVTFDRGGNAYFMSLSLNDPDGTLNPDDNAMLVSRSRDGGRTWGPVTTLIRENLPGVLNDKNSITGDPTRPNTVYAIWDRLAPDAVTGSFRGPALFTRTTNGRTWETPRAIFDPGPASQTLGSQIAVLPNGDLVNVMTTIVLGRELVTVMRSTNSGRTWTSPVFVDQLFSFGALDAGGVIDPRDGAPVRTGDIIPDIAVDPRPGRRTVYVTWQDARFSGFTADGIVVAKSSDGGVTWDAPVPVNTEAPAVQAFTPSVEVNSRGEVAVSYADFTFDTVESITLDTDYWSTRSTDGGATFGPRERLTPESFDTRAAPPTARGFFLGDYSGLAARGRSFLAANIVANSNAPDNASDLIVSAISGPSAPALTSAQVGLGVRTLPAVASDPPFRGAAGSATPKPVTSR